MPVIRKVQSKVVKQPDRTEETGNKGTSSNGETRARKGCYFCKNKTEPVYWDALVLRRFVSDRGRIIPRTRTGACAKHQRRVTRGVKQARFLALMAFAPRA